jgi:hypothetical protein
MKGSTDDPRLYIYTALIILDNVCTGEGGEGREEEAVDLIVGGPVRAYVVFNERKHQLTGVELW